MRIATGALILAVLTPSAASAQTLRGSVAAPPSGEAKKSYAVCGTAIDGAKAGSQICVVKDLTDLEFEIMFKSWSSRRSPGTKLCEGQFAQVRQRNCVSWNGVVPGPATSGGSRVATTDLPRSPAPQAAPRQIQPRSVDGEREQRVADWLERLGPHRRDEAERLWVLERDAAAARARDSFKGCGRPVKGQSCVISY
jgi:hypothetical protein